MFTWLGVWFPIFMDFPRFIRHTFSSAHRSIERIRYLPGSEAVGSHLVSSGVLELTLSEEQLRFHGCSVISRARWRWHHGLLWCQGTVRLSPGGPQSGGCSGPSEPGWHPAFQGTPFSDLGLSCLSSVFDWHARVWMTDVLTGGGSGHGISRKMVWVP